VSDIFREIEDELRRDNLSKLWQRFGKYIIAVMVLALLAAGGVAAWLSHQQALRQAEGTRYSNALLLLRTGKEAEARKAFGELAQQGGGYGALAAFEHAALLAKSGDAKAAVAAYDRLAEDSNIGPDLRRLAVLLSVMLGLPTGDPHAAIARLKPLTATGDPWRFSALDLTAAAELKAGDRGGARNIYQKLADDPTAPQGLRARAAEMAAALKS
jgi:hypothetical protein